MRHGERVRDARAHPLSVHAWEPLHTFDYEFVPSDLDISPDGRLLSASISEVERATSTCACGSSTRSLTGDFTPLSEFRFGQSVPENFTFSHDGRYLYGSSYYTGVSNIFRYEVATGAVDAVTNAETGFFRPVPLSDGRLVVLNYTGAGFVPAIIDPKPIQDVERDPFLGAEVAEKHPIVTTWQVPPPSTVDDEKLVIASGPYEPLKNLRSLNAYPVLQGYKDSIGVGYQFNIEDPLELCAGRDHRGLHAGRRAADRASGRTSRSRRATSAGAPASRGTARTSTTCSARRSAARKGYAATLGYDHLADPRRSATAGAHHRHRVVRQDRHAAEARARRPAASGVQRSATRRRQSARARCSSGTVAIGPTIMHENAAGRRTARPSRVQLRRKTTKAVIRAAHCDAASA